MSTVKGLSDRAQAYIMIGASACLSVGAFLSVQTSDPRWIILGGTLSAVAMGVKEALGGQAPVAK